MKITPDLVKRTLADNTDGFKFENFAQSFFSAISENTYKPVGGIHDGGADGIFENDDIYEIDGKNTHFIQISIEKNPRSKINKTIKRLQSYGRRIQQLIYITSIVVEDIDSIEDQIFEEFHIQLRIRDSVYIAHNIQYSRQTEEAFKVNLLDTYDFLRQFGHNSITFPVSQKDSPFLYAFLQQELNDKSDRSSLTNILTDSLILWALEETDPDKNILFTAQQILEKILESMPTAKTFINGTLQHRLVYLHQNRNKNNERIIRYWKKQNAYCLPFSTRIGIIEKNIEDEELYSEVTSLFSEKIRQLAPEGFKKQDIDLLVLITFKTLHIVFENEGLEFVAFIQNPDKITHSFPVAHSIEKAFTENVYKGNHTIAKDIVKKLMQHVFYQNCEKAILLYLQKLSETYTLLLSLKADSRIVDYFQGMSSKFSLYVGSDILVRALSERYLDEPNKTTTNMLKILGNANSELYLTEYVLDEVWNNLKTSDFEYKNHFASIDQYMKLELAKESSKILIRAYYYNKLSAQSKVRTWAAFVDNFCDYSNLHRNTGKEQLKRYLIHLFALQYMSSEDIADIVDSSIIDTLSLQLKEVKKSDELAVNAATMVDLIFKKRRLAHESTKSNRFGYSTWWLTTEKSTLMFTASLVQKNNGYYIIRPEFLLHYISLVPSNKDIKKTYKNIFPSILGIKMAGRIPTNEYHQLLKNLTDAQEKEPARLEVLIEDTINKLKGDFERVYDDVDDVI